MRLEDRAADLDQMAREVQAHRAANNGRVPFEVFPSVLAIGGLYVCCDLVLTDEDGFVAVRLRNPQEEQGWENQYHLPGGAVLVHEAEEDFLPRILKQLVIPDRIEIALRRSHFLGNERHTEPERDGVTCWTFVYVVEFNKSSSAKIEDMLDPDAKWTWVSPEMAADQRFPLVDHHRGTILRFAGVGGNFPDPSQSFVGM